MRLRNLILLFALLALALPAGAADNELGQPQYQANTQRIQMRTTDSGGVHTPHVMVDSGGVLARSSTIATAQTTLNSSTAVSIAALNTARQSILIRNTDAAISIYVGAAGVTSSTGLILKAGETLTIHSTAALFAISASGAPVAYTLSEND